MVYKVPYTKEYSPLAEQLRKMGKEQLDIAMWNLHTIQLTQGCSVGCYFCGCNVPRGVREVIPVEIVDFIAENFQPQFELRLPYLSGNNDPLDWQSRGKDFRYAAYVLTKNGSWFSGASSAVPQGKEKIALDCITQDYLSRISVSSMNKKRLKSRVPEIFSLAREHGVQVFYPEKNLISMGRNSDGNYEANSLSNRVGTMITPLGILNINMTHPSRRFPTGEIESYISPADFKVVEWGRRKDLPVDIWDYWVFGRNGAFPVQMLGDKDGQAVDRNIAAIHMFLKMFYSISGPTARDMQDDYLHAAEKVLLKTIPCGDFGRINPTNSPSSLRLEKCIEMIPRMIRGLSAEGDFWSRRKRKLLEETVAIN